MTADGDAAKYRRRLREAEAHRDRLQAHLDALDRAHADDTITALGVRPEAVWATGTDLAALRDDDGNLDPDRVTAAAQAAADTLGLTPPPQPTGIGGLSSGAMQRPERRDRFADAFRPADR